MTDTLHAKILDLDHQFVALTGRRAFGYISHPTPTSTRIAFGDGRVKTSMESAYAHLMTLVETARTDPRQLPYPFNQELTPEQDLRNDPRAFKQ